MVFNSKAKIHYLLYDIWMLNHATALKLFQMKRENQTKTQHPPHTVKDIYKNVEICKEQDILII